MRKDLLESGEFYGIRFQNFSTLLIIPVTLLLIGTILFSLVAKREIVINGTGTVQPTGTVPVIQATVNSAIKKNYLVEGARVKKGQNLLVYTNVFNRNKLREDNVSKRQLQRQVTALDHFKDGINTDSDVFPTTDEFGYRELLQSYLKQRQIYLTENQMLAAKSSAASTKKATLTKTAQQVVSNTKTNLDAYQALYNAVANGSKYANSAKYGSVFNEYVAKSKEANNANDKKEVKSATLADIQQQIDTLQDSLSSAKVQLEELQDFDDTKYSVETNNTKLAMLKNDQLSEVAEKRMKAEQDLRTVKADIDSLTTQSKSYTIKATKAGVLHVADNYRGAKYVSSGAEIAKILPIIKQQRRVNVKLYISTADISSVKVKQAIRFKVTRNVPKPIILDGVVTKIGVSPVEESKATFYEVTAAVPITADQAQLLRYGMIGQTTIITGKVTWFDYYKDKVLDNN
ncbi:HlyD family secretion protein [Lactiplantibacillus plantarum]|uniref:HlyD family secretion protein n=3 Tax=Lactiplantibacillus plantarum TaxID=1590 RepID=UPI0030D3E05A